MITDFYYNERKKIMKILMIGAHQDDNEFRCGAIAHKYVKLGHEAREDTANPRLLKSFSVSHTTYGTLTTALLWLTLKLASSL